MDEPTAEIQPTILPDSRGHRRARVDPGVTPDFVKQLIKKVGKERAGQIIGYSAATITGWMKQRNCPTAAEMAAKLVMQERFSAQARDTPETAELLILRVPNSKSELLYTFLKGMDIRYTRFRD